MLEPIKKFLESSKKENVKLTFLERKIDSYIGKSASISPEIGGKFLEKATRQINAILGYHPVYFEHGELPGSDQKIITYLAENDVPNLGEIVAAIGGRLEPVKKEDWNKVWGYILTIVSEDGKTSLLLFKKYTPKKLLEKGKILAIFEEEGFEYLKEGAFVFESTFDAAMILSSGSTKKATNLIILNPSKFESLFSYVDAYQDVVTAHQPLLVKHGLLADTDPLISGCQENSRMIRKLARVLKSGEYAKITKVSAKKISRDYKLGLSFDAATDCIIVTPESIWPILALLSDDYLKSEATSNKYEAHSKVKK